jgi:hypothetical protein
MTDIKRYTVKDQWGDLSVTLEADHAILTPERAEMFLRFWTSADEHIDTEDGDAVRAAIRAFGTDTMYHMLGDLGASFKNEAVADIWSKKMRDIEGFGGEDETKYGWIGIRIISAEVQSPSFDEVELNEI